MNNEQEIEKIAKLINELCKEVDPLCFDKNMATAIINAGIGDKKQAVREFAIKIRDIRATVNDSYLLNKIFYDIYGEEL